MFYLGFVIMQRLAHLIFDDHGYGMKNGSLALINGKHERIIHIEDDQICIHGWSDDELIFSVERADQDPQREDWPNII